MLQGKHILLTGASSGIGSKIAEILDKEGAILTLVGRNTNRLSETLSRLQGQHKIISCDLTNPSEVDDLINQASSLNGIVFCAGINEFTPAKFIKQEKIDAIFQTNYFSQILLVQKLLKKKLIQKGASLVFISSVSSLMGVPGTMLYAASKAAMNSSVKVLASELASQKIRANAICPGIVKTPMIGNTNISEEQFLEQEKLYPLGLGDPEDVANAVTFHLSDKSRWLTGNIMILDGGYSLQ